MENSNDILDKIIGDLQTCQPQLSQPDRVVDKVLIRIEAQRGSQKKLLALRISCMAASLLLLFGLITLPDGNADDVALIGYQSKHLHQRMDENYMKSKFVDKQIYDIIKNQTSYENNY